MVGGTVALLLARCDDCGHRQLRGWLRALPRGRSRPADPRDGRGGGHSRRGHGRRAGLGLGNLSPISRRARSPIARHRCRRLAAAQPIARLCHGQARRRARTGHAGGYGADAPAGAGSPGCRSHRLRHVAPADPPHQGRREHPELCRRRCRTQGHYRRHAGERQRASSRWCSIPPSRAGRTNSHTSSP